MPSIRLIKGRIKSAKNISQITKAMELVSASKMKKAQAQAMAGKIYADKIFEMVMRLAQKVDMSNHPLLAKPKIATGKRLVILITTNKGLCGGLNTNLFRFALQTYTTQKNNAFVTVGKKGIAFVTAAGSILEADFSGQVPFSAIVPALTSLVIEQYVSGKIDGVDIIYNQFLSALKQIPRKKTILPLTIEPVMVNKKEEDEQAYEFMIEPDVVEVFGRLLPHYVENQIRDAILQAEASEHSARMVAMRNATDNAKSFIQELTLVYNKVRQEKITYEISDMVTARIAIQ